MSMKVILVFMRIREFDAIKESIRERGVIQRIVVTKRPGSDRFVLAQGGNTRLRCLRELHAETGDRKFPTTLCEYRVWTSEEDFVDRSLHRK